MNAKFIGFFLIGLVLVSGCSNQAQTPAPAVTNNGGGDNGGSELTVGNFTVEITANGYEPRELTIKKGSRVTWVNKTSTPNWPASAMHPTHEKYPGSSITKCGTAEQGGIFDACKNLSQGESWSFTFNELGAWAYHDHVEAKKFGKITVVE